MPGLIELGTEQARLLTTIGMASEVRRLEAACARLQTDTFRVLVIGEFSRGKSMLINALLGAEILATSMLRLPVVNLVRGGAERTARAGRPGDLPSALKEVELDSITRSEEVTQVELTWDAAFLQDGIEIAEYPSMSEAPDGDLFRAAVESADLVVVAVACDSLYSHVEADIVQSVVHAAGHRKPLFVANFIDRIALKDREEVKRAARVRLPVNQDRIFFVSAQDALDGVQEAVDGIAALRDKILEEARSREGIKTTRLHRLVTDSLDAADARLDAAAISSGEQKSQAEGEIKMAREAFRKLQDLHTRIQRDLIEFRNGTSDVLRAQVGTFVRGLAIKVDEWGRDYNGPDLAGRLNQKLKDALSEFESQDFGKYLRTRLQEQEDLLTNGLTSYRRQLSQLYDLLSEDLPDVRMEWNPFGISPNLGNVEVIGRQSSSAPSPGILDLQSLRSAPVAMLTLVGTIVGSIFFVQHALIVIPAGLAMTAYLVSRQRRTRAIDNELKAYAAQISEQVGRLEVEVVRRINSEIDNLHTQVTQLLNTITQTAQSAVQARIANRQSGIKGSGEPARASLERIRAALSALN